jgi:sulfotransferase
MDRGIHFISGLPRSGSTLLAALLSQDPALHAGITSPVGGLYSALRREMSATNEGAVFIGDDQREAVLRGLFANYYHAIHAERTVIDTNRLWCAHLSSVAALFPRARVIACVRHVPWIIDSVESLIRRNVWQPSKIFEGDNGGTMWQRVDGMAGPAGLVGFAWNALKQAFFSNEADRMMLLTYKTLTTEPEFAMAEVYRFLGLMPFRHDFENVKFDVTEFDARLGTPGLHSVGRSVRCVERQTVLTPELWARFENDDFWRPPAPNPRGVKVV